MQNTHTVSPPTDHARPLSAPFAHLVIRALSVLTCGVFLWPLTATPARGSDLDWGQLPNGLEYVLVEDHIGPEVAVSGCFRVGGRTEAMEQKGLTHFLEHLIGRRGTGRLSEEEWQSVRSRIDYTAYTGHDGSCYDFQVPATELADALRHYSRALFELEITEASVDLEREVVLQEWARGLGMPFGPEQHRLWPTAFTKHPYRTLTIGRDDVVRTTNAEKLRALHSERFRPNHLFLAVVGDFDRSEVKDLIRETLGGYAAGAPSFELDLTEPPQDSYREVLIDSDDALGPLGRSRLLLGCKAPSASHPDAAALDVAARLLGHGPGSRLASALLDSETAVSISATSSATRDPGLFVFELEPVPGKEAASLSMFWKVLREVADRGASAQELERETRSLEVDRALSRESLMNRARAFTAAELAGSYTLALSRNARLREVSEADISRAVASHLSPDRCSLVASVASPDAGGWRHIADETVAVWPRLENASRSAATVDRLKWSNGLTALVEERPGRSTQAMELLIVGASWDIPEKLTGLGQVAAQVLVLQPVENDTTFEELVTSVGGRLQVHSAPDHIGVAVESLVEDFPRVAEALFTALASPRVTTRLVDSARRRAEAVISIESTRTEWLAESRLFAALFPRHPYGSTPTSDSLRGIDDAELSELFDRMLNGHRVVVALVGGLDTDSAEALLSGSLGNLPPGSSWRGPRSAPLDGSGLERVSSFRDVPQSQVATGVATVGARDDDFLSLRVAARLLWSRLFYRFVRGDEPIAYWLRADLQARVGPSPFWVQAGISRSEESRLLRGISEEVEVLGSGPLGPEELERARSRLVDELSPREGHREQARLRAENELLFGQGAALDELANRIRKVSADDVRRVVEEYLLSTEWPVSVVGRGARRDVSGH